LELAAPVAEAGKLIHQDTDIHEVGQFTHVDLASLIRVVGGHHDRDAFGVDFLLRVPSMVRLFRNTRIGTLGALLESEKRLQETALVLRPSKAKLWELVPNTGANGIGVKDWPFHFHKI
jgi:hypothetical protein